MLHTDYPNTIEEAVSLPIMPILSEVAIKLNLKVTALRKKQLAERITEEYQKMFPQLESLAISLLGGNLNELWQKQIPILKTPHGYSLEYTTGVRIIVLPDEGDFNEVSIYILETRVATFVLEV